MNSLPDTRLPASNLLTSPERQRRDGTSHPVAGAPGLCDHLLRRGDMSPGWRFGLVLTVMLPAAFGCHSSSAESPVSSAEAERLVKVAIVYPERTVLHREVAEPGTIEAFEQTQVFAKIAGYVKEGWKDIGATLRKGEALAELSAPELVDELQQKEALIEQAVVAIAQAREAVTIAEKAYHSSVAQVEMAEANRQMLHARHERARLQHERLQRVGTSVLDQENVEEARLGHETARAGLTEAEAKIKASQATRDENKARWSKVEADLRAAEVNRKVAEKNRDCVKDQVAYLRLTAPYDCLVTQRNVNTGDFVQTGTANKDRPLYTVRRTDLMRVVVQVPEIEAGWVEKGAVAALRVPALRGQTFTGRVARVSWSLDPTMRTLRAEVDLANTTGQLRPGLYAYATLSTDTPDVRTLPRSAVRTEGEVTRGYETHCYQVVDGKARHLRIETGSEGGGRVEVLKKQVPPAEPGKPPQWVDFTGEERIVKDQAAGLKDGQAVTIEP
jgi:RND family efflux transporter MFP subunit